MTEAMTQRAERLGKLLAASQLPPASLAGIREALPRMNARQVDLLIEALGREQQEWDRLEEILFEAQRDLDGRVGTVRDDQELRAAKLVDKVADDAEREEADRLREDLTSGA